MVVEALVIPLWAMAVVAVLLIAATFVLVALLKRLLYNTALGLLALLIINWLGKPFGIAIAINLFSVLLTALLGLAGVGLLIILNLAGVRL